MWTLPVLLVNPQLRSMSSAVYTVSGGLCPASSVTNILTSSLFWRRRACCFSAPADNFCNPREWLHSCKDNMDTHSHTHRRREKNKLLEDRICNSSFLFCSQSSLQTMYSKQHKHQHCSCCECVNQSKTFGFNTAHSFNNAVSDKVLINNDKTSRRTAALEWTASAKELGQQNKPSARRRVNTFVA